MSNLFEGILIETLITREKLLNYVVENEGNHEYSMVAVELPKEIDEKRLEFVFSIPNEEIYNDSEDTSFGRELEGHITVKYGLTAGVTPGDVNKNLNWLSSDRKVKLGNVGVFSGEENEKEYDVVKVEVESEVLKEMHNLLSKLPNEDEHSDYKPHMTLAYVKKGLGKHYEGKQDFMGLEFEVTEVVFKDSEGNSQKVGI